MVLIWQFGNWSIDNIASIAKLKLTNILSCVHKATSILISIITIFTTAKSWWWDACACWAPDLTKDVIDFTRFYFAHIHHSCWYTYVWDGEYSTSTSAAAYLRDYIISSQCHQINSPLLLSGHFLPFCQHVIISHYTVRVLVWGTNVYWKI